MSLPIVRPVPSLSIGGTIIPLSSAIFLTAYNSASTGYCTLFRNGAAYQVPTGKKLVLVSTTVNTSSNVDVIVGYGDTNVNSTSAPTNAVTFILSNATAQVSCSNAYPASLYCEIPAGKYPFVRQSLGTPVYQSMMGYLVNV